MDLEEKRIIAGLIRRLAQSRADKNLMIKILAQCEKHKDWPAELEALRKSPDYDGVIGVFEPTARALEQGAEIDTVIALLHQLDGGKFPK
jgi:hypothetical protein